MQSHEHRKNETTSKRIYILVEHECGHEKYSKKMLKMPSIPADIVRTQNSSTQDTIQTMGRGWHRSI